MSDRSPKNSKEWLRRHVNDPFVQQSVKDGYRSRAAYKLLQLHDKYKFFKPGQCVVDLGAAPGGWSQVAIQKVGDNGKVFALDRLDMKPIAGVTFIQGDFTESEVETLFISALEGQKVDVVLSDMAPNLSGEPSVDQPRAIYLCELALDFAMHYMKPSGTLVMKTFHGKDFESLLKALRAQFKIVKVEKPEASRVHSKEVYFLASGFKL